MGGSHEGACHRDLLARDCLLVSVCGGVKGGGGYSLYSGLYKRAPPKRGTFFRLSVTIY